MKSTYSLSTSTNPKARLETTKRDIGAFERGNATCNMSRTATVRKYGKGSRKQTAEVLFAQLPRTPVKADPQPEVTPVLPADEIEIGEIAAQLEATRLDDTVDTVDTVHTVSTEEHTEAQRPDHVRPSTPKPGRLEDEEAEPEAAEDSECPDSSSYYDDFRVLTWADLCPAGDGIEKIAEASYAEVYRITNAHGTSIIKAVRLESPLKPQTKAQARSGLVDEAPHAEADMHGELRISDWLADIPGFVVYKEQYVVRGRAPRALLETHQAFHRREKRKDPDRLQFYPSPSRYLDDTRFLVVELGDAGTALEDFQLTSVSQVWDIFLHTALALARAEDLVEFEVCSHCSALSST